MRSADHGLSWLGALVGAGVGAGAVVFGTIAQASMTHPSLTGAALVSAHLHSPALWLVDFAPFLLAWLGWLGGQAEDIGPVADALERSRAREIRLRQMIQGVPDAVLVIDAEGMIIDANAAADHLLGYTRKHVITGRPAAEVVPGWASLSDDRAILRHNSVGEEVYREWITEAVRRDAVRFEVETSRYRNDGITVLAMRDRIDARRDAERAERTVRDALRDRDAALASLREQGDALSSMAHEIRTPLNAVLGYTDLLREAMTEGEPPAIADLNRVTAAAQHALAVIVDQLDRAKLEAGRMSVLLEQVDVAPIVTEVLDTVRPIAARTSTTLTLDLSPEVLSVRADPLRLKQVLINLLGNAIKFTGKGEVVLRVALDTEGADVVAFHVIDTGPGMSTEQVGALFQAFSQVGNREQRAKGTGIGLALSHRLAGLMACTLSATSELGKGSTFTLRASGRARRNTLAEGELKPTARRASMTLMPATLDERRLPVLLFSADAALSAAHEDGLEARGYRLGRVDTQAAFASAVQAGTPLAVVVDGDGSIVPEGFDAVPRIALGGAVAHAAFQLPAGADSNALLDALARCPEPGAKVVAVVVMAPGEAREALFTQLGKVQVTPLVVDDATLVLDRLGTHRAELLIVDSDLEALDTAQLLAALWGDKALRATRVVLVVGERSDADDPARAARNVSAVAEKSGGVKAIVEAAQRARAALATIPRSRRRLVG